MKTANRRRPAGAPAAAVPAGFLPVAALKPRRPEECRKHLRTAVAGAFDEIIAGFLKQAKSGSCQHVKMALEMVEPKKRERAGKGSAELMLAELEKQMGPLD